jgi:hypothetical protein
VKDMGELLHEIIEFEEKKKIFKKYLNIVFKNPTNLLKNKNLELYTSNNGCMFFVSYDEQYEEIDMYVANHHHFKPCKREEYTQHIRRYLPKIKMVNKIVEFSKKVGVL